MSGPPVDAAAGAGDRRRVYELVSTRPAPALEIPVTLAQQWLGPRASERLIEWYVTHRRSLTWVSNAARICAVTCWFLPLHVSHTLVVPLLVCGLPKLVCTLCMLSVPIHRLLAKQYEYWFTTTLNVLCAVVFSIQLGVDLRLGFALLTFMSIQVTISSDADVYSVQETTRAGMLSTVCAGSLAGFAIHRSVHHARLLASPHKDWQLAAVNLLFNAAWTLAIFVTTKSYKRRSIILHGLQSTIPLAVCRAKLAVHSRVTKEAAVVEPLNDRDVQPILEGQIESKDAASQVPPTANRRRSSCLISNGVHPFRVRPLRRKPLCPSRTLFPRMCLKRPLHPWQFGCLTACAIVGLGTAAIGLLLIIIIDVRDRAVLYPIALASLVFTTAFFLVHAAHYQRDLVRLVVHNFDFWFTSMQFTAATICLADLLQWDYRCLTIVSWSVWFHWVLLTDAMLSSHRRKLCFKKRYATLVLLAVLFGILVLAYSLAIDTREILLDRVLELRWIGSFSTTTRTFMAYRLATIWLWTVRLVTRLAYDREDELVLLRAQVEYRNPFLQNGASTK